MGPMCRVPTLPAPSSTRRSPGGAQVSTPKVSLSLSPPFIPWAPQPRGGFAADCDFRAAELLARSLAEAPGAGRQVSGGGLVRVGGPRMTKWRERWPQGRPTMSDEQLKWAPSRALPSPITH